MFTAHKRQSPSQIDDVSIKPCLGNLSESQTPGNSKAVFPSFATCSSPKLDPVAVIHTPLRTKQHFTFGTPTAQNVEGMYILY